MTLWENFWNIFWWFFIVYASVAFLYALFMVIGDLFRDDQMNGWWRALWILFLAFVPFLTLLVYMVARGQGMAERSMGRARRDQAETGSYIRGAAAVSPSQEISKARALLDAGTISPDEFERIKTRVAA